MKELEGLNINILCPLFHSLSNSGVLPRTYLLSWIVVTAHYPWDTQDWAGPGEAGSEISSSYNWLHSAAPLSSAS